MLFSSRTVTQMFSYEDVVGVLKEQIVLREYMNDKEENKKQKKFSITDGRFDYTTNHVHS